MFAFRTVAIAAVACLTVSMFVRANEQPKKNGPKKVVPNFLDEFRN